MNSRDASTTLARKSLKFLLICMAVTGMGERLQATEHDIEQQNRQLVRGAFDAWRSGKGGVFDLLAPDAKWTIVGNSPISRTYSSRQEFMDVVIAPFNARLKKRLIPTVRGIYVDGDMVVALFDAEGTASDGRAYRNTYTWYIKIREKRVVEVTAFFDTVDLTDLWTRINPESGPTGSAKNVRSVQNHH